MAETPPRRFFEELKSYQDQINPEIAATALQWDRRTDGEPGDAVYETDRILADFSLEPGKRLRGSLVLVGHELFNGRKRKAALHVARLVEDYQDVLLILDDYDDDADTRRGQPSVPNRFMQYAASLGHIPNENIYTHGNKLAVNAAFLKAHWAQYELMQTPVSATKKVQLAEILNSNMIPTGEGQALDLTTGYTDETTEAQIINMTKKKTAYYSFVGPLQLGAALAGANTDDMQTLKKFGEHVGLAFQLQDDKLGMIGDENEMGKSATNDLREGKETLLMFKALELADAKQKAVLLAAKGNPDVTAAEHRTVQKIIRDTGALEYVETMAFFEATAAHDILAAHPEWNEKGVRFLRHIVSYILIRDS